MRVSKLTDAELRERMNLLARIPGKVSSKTYMVALDEAIRREEATKQP